MAAQNRGTVGQGRLSEKLAVALALAAVIYTVVTGAAELRYQARAREALAQVTARLAAGAVSAQYYATGRPYADQTSPDGFADGVADAIETLGALPGTVTLLQIGGNGYAVENCSTAKTVCTPSTTPPRATACSARRIGCNTARRSAMLLLECLLGLIRFLLGAALFSFMNVVAWRLPRNMDPLKGRSICPRCGRTLDAPDLVPVFSWLFLRGRCRHCGAHIPARYLLVEVLGGVLALGCTRQYGAALWSARRTVRHELGGAAGAGGLRHSFKHCAHRCRDADHPRSAEFRAGDLRRGRHRRPRRVGGHIIGAVCVSVPMFCSALPLTVRSAAAISN